MPVYRKFHWESAKKSTYCPFPGGRDVIVPPNSLGEGRRQLTGDSLGEGEVLPRFLSSMSSELALFEAANFFLRLTAENVYFSSGLEEPVWQRKKNPNILVGKGRPNAIIFKLYHKSIHHPIEKKVRLKAFCTIQGSSEGYGLVDPVRFLAQIHRDSYAVFLSLIDKCLNIRKTLSFVNTVFLRLS